MAVSARYGFFRDELYFLVASRSHPAPGYVDMPPLAPFLERVSTALCCATSVSCAYDTARDGRSPQAETAVHQKLGAAAVTRIGAQQERDGPSHLVGLGKAFEHDPSHPLVELVRLSSQ